MNSLEIIFDPGGQFIQLVYKHQTSDGYISRMLLIEKDAGDGECLVDQGQACEVAKTSSYPRLLSIILLGSSSDLEPKSHFPRNFFLINMSVGYEEH